MHPRPWIIAVATLATVAATVLIASLTLASPARSASSASPLVTQPTHVATTASAVAPTAAATTPSPTPSPTHSASPTTVKTTSSPTPTSTATTHSGVATEYAAGDGDGACLFGPSSTMMIAAMNYTDYDNSEACGDHILVRAADGASITVLITNECPAPCAPGQLDLSQQAFAKLAAPSAGRIPITWQLLSPATTQTISLRYKTGSSRYWCALQVIGERNPVARLELSTGSGWSALPRTDYNYFLSASGTGCGGTVRITDIYGQQLTVSGISVQPDVVQGTQVQFNQR